MKRIRFVPGAIVSPNAITIPTGLPDIEAVVAAEITRIPAALTVAHTGSAAPLPHAAGATPLVHAGFAVDPHADHAHDIISQGTGLAPVVPIGYDAIPLAQLEDAGAAALHTFAGGGATGVQNSTLSAHVVTQPGNHTQAEVAAAVIHNAADVALALINHATSGLTPAVAATPTRLTTRTLSLNVNTVLGDLLTLDYYEVGERVLVS